jgi:hypothetical protein
MRETRKEKKRKRDLLKKEFNAMPFSCAAVICSRVEKEKERK